MTKWLPVGILGLALTCAGCDGLNSRQESELRAMESDNVAVREKSPGTGAALGILPGCGSCYTRQWGMGVVDLLLWPLSVLWDPISGYNGAKEINYDVSRENVKRLKKQEMETLDQQLADKKISSEEYTLQSRKIDKKYSYD